MCNRRAAEERVIYIVRPDRLTLERIEGEVAESFLPLELANLKTSGVYDESDDEGREELLEVGTGQYHDRAILDHGCPGHDENGDELPVPDDYRLSVRRLKGKLLFVAKASM